ncbi:hypothetical protein GRI44_13065 [Altererythrobacter confluentis]|uniref:Uncharacterized protein n=1 Tax=Allopontixanthobacter confluentis TaxID=1849021 RepID=A0A6L7GJI8_9SPHN|nr:hypothetical protein [Allopontixanthobacter confluentis]MXP15680.1 hypothetical protein [Allopontixanthobacter confluentis]
MKNKFLRKILALLSKYTRNPTLSSPRTDLHNSLEVTSVKKALINREPWDAALNWQVDEEQELLRSLYKIGFNPEIAAKHAKRGGRRFVKNLQQTRSQVAFEWLNTYGSLSALSERGGSVEQAITIAERLVKLRFSEKIFASEHLLFAERKAI